MDFGISVPVHDLDDQFETECRSVVQLPFATRIRGEDIIVELTLPEMDLCKIAVYIAPTRFAITAEINKRGLKICQLIELPLRIMLDGVDAEQLGNRIRIAAALAGVDQEPAERPGANI